MIISRFLLKPTNHHDPIRWLRRRWNNHPLEGKGLCHKCWVDSTDNKINHQAFRWLVYGLDLLLLFLIFIRINFGRTVKDFPSCRFNLISNFDSSENISRYLEMKLISIISRAKSITRHYRISLKKHQQKPTGYKLSIESVFFSIVHLQLFFPL